MAVTTTFCATHIPYATAAEAHAVARRMIRRRGRGLRRKDLPGRHVQAYRCGDHWHLGHNGLGNDH